jgi:hypothetical protein
MDPQYGDWFESAFIGEPRGQQFPPFAPDGLDDALRQMIKEADQRLRSEHDRALRPDAKLFLLINFRDMIARPLDAVGDDNDRQQLREGLASDVWTVTDAAGRAGPPDSEVSSHEVVNALNRNWDQMVTLRTRLWDRHR